MYESQKESPLVGTVDACMEVTHWLESWASQHIDMDKW